MELIISKARRSEGEMKAPVSATGLRQEVQTFIDCNAKVFEAQTTVFCSLKVLSLRCDQISSVLFSGNSCCKYAMRHLFSE